METLTLIIIVGLFLLFFIIAGLGAFFILSRLKWNYKFTVYENIAGTGYIPTKKGRARLMSFGDGGEEIFFLKGSKKWRIAYGKRIGKNHVAWAIGEDGYWYNITFGNLDKRLSELGVNPVDRDMRYAYSSVRKGIDNRYDKKNFMEKYGVVIAFGMLFLCIVALAGTMWVVFNGQSKVSTTNGEVAKTNLQVVTEMKELLSNLDNIKTGGSGAVVVH